MANMGWKSLMESPDFRVWVWIQSEKGIQGCFVYLGIHVADATFGMKLTREIRSNVDKKYCVVQ